GIFGILTFVLVLSGGTARAAGAESPVSEDRVEIPGGEFMMGSHYCAERRNNDEWCRDETPHRVFLNAFEMDKYEVTNRQYQRCFEAGICEPNELHENRPSDFNRPHQPVVFVTWSDARTYCTWKGGRLPTEAEWERAAQGENRGDAHFGQPYDQGAPRKVGEGDPNSQGLFDMMGNVYEWTQDWYGPYPTQGLQKNPRGPDQGHEKVVR
ncbi:MAG: SUMF1/EgtB/PvdO family nonheme iron enzyme, partial [Nitrospinaceae bacterium]|nr:formylglycine-generating enzyme family protein [Nitrospinaceae bacterium]NIR56282.1 formylglycine-generating enzyme family protein [Nitrospinaceae bacterium]NIS86739.1 formylglycine-generating enzyme family protein [Nitrospinaceae bacterium]NIT84125.1 formylglycine-generating enzyme family protein [Nitrospinaceae bacterium]NIU45776.1 formylglycine-generating enzyme family protein [Nitrospinaceae bacterium]